jgi:hypothetical protein
MAMALSSRLLRLQQARSTAAAEHHLDGELLDATQSPYGLPLPHAVRSPLRPPSL